MRYILLALLISACQPAAVNPALVGEPDPIDSARTIQRPTFCLPEGDTNEILGESAFISDARYSTNYLKVVIEDYLSEQGIIPAEYTAVTYDNEGTLGVLVTVADYDPNPECRY